jgi:hypothetical protein
MDFNPEIMYAVIAAVTGGSTSLGVMRFRTKEQGRKLEEVQEDVDALKQSTTDRLARIETKLDILLTK